MTATAPTKPNPRDGLVLGCFLPRNNPDGLDMLCLTCAEVLHFGKKALLPAIKKSLIAHKLKDERSKKAVSNEVCT